MKGGGSNGFDSGCEFVGNVLGKGGKIKFLGEKGRKLVDEELKNEDWQKKTVNEVLKEESGGQGCLLDKIMNSSDSEFRPFYLIDVNQFSTIKGQSGLINFGRKENEKIKLAGWGIYQSRKKFNDRITKIRIIEGEGRGRKLTYDLYISEEWVKQIENWEAKSNKDKDIVLSLAEFWPREGSEDNEQKGLTNLIWKTRKGKWNFARFELGLAPAVKDLKNKVGYLEGSDCKHSKERFGNIDDKELCRIDLRIVEGQKWQTWFPRVLEELEGENNSNPFKKGECENLNECIKKAMENPNNKGDMVGVWGEVGILDDGGGVRWRSF